MFSILYCLLLLPFTVNAQDTKPLWGHWESIIETRIDTITGTYIAEIDSQKILIPGATVHLNFSVIEKLEFDTDGLLRITKQNKDQSRIYQLNAQGEQSDITENIPGLGESQIVSLHKGFYSLDGQAALSIWLPDSTSQAFEQSTIIPLTVSFQGDTLSTQDPAGTQREYIRVARISVKPEGQKEIIEGKNGILGDLDADGDVDFADFINFSQNFGKTGDKPTEFIRTVIRTERDTIFLSVPSGN